MFQIKDLQYFFGATQVLNIPNWQAQQGEQWLLLGGSGSGKTTLLHLLVGLRQTKIGEIILVGKNIKTIKGSSLDKFRAQNIGLVFQKPHLISTLTVMQNMLLAQYMAGLKQDKKRCLEVLTQLDIQSRKNAYPHQLSQGQAQRVSVARAVLNQPKLILADEPTASLDDKNATQVIDLLKLQAQKYQATLVIATHDKRVKEQINLAYEL